MEKELIIKVDHVSMKFNLASEKFDSLKEYIIKSLKKQVSYNEFWALKDVSFEEYRGESLALLEREYIPEWSSAGIFKGNDEFIL